MSPVFDYFNYISARCIKKKVTPLIKADGQTSILIHSKRKVQSSFTQLSQNYNTEEF